LKLPSASRRMKIVVVTVTAFNWRSEEMHKLRRRKQPLSHISFRFG
jgi:hypothetical protein